MRKRKSVAYHDIHSFVRLSLDKTNEILHMSQGRGLYTLLEVETEILRYIDELFSQFKQWI